MSGTTARQIGRYEVLDALGQNGAAAVFLACDPILGREVAIHTILASSYPAEDQEDVRLLLLKEGQAAAGIRHSGIVNVFDAIQEGDETYIVQEHVTGIRLSELLLGERLRRDTTIRILHEIAQALDYAHERGIIHQDIKPDNILLDSALKVRIANFGIARSLTRQNMTPADVETACHMSPEHFRKSPEIGAAADQYSLGVIAYSMLTGRKPFDGAALGLKFAGEGPPPASKIDKALPAGIDPVLMRALSPNPSARYPGCVAFVDELERALDQRGAVRKAINGALPRRMLVFATLVAAVAVWGAIWKFWLAPQTNFALSLYNKSNVQVTPGQHFSAGDPDGVPGAGDLSAAVSADRAISPSARVELMLTRSGKILDHATLPAVPSRMRHTFSSPMPPGQYLVRLSVNHVPTSEVRFAIDSAPVPTPQTWAVEIRVRGKLVGEGDKFAWKDPVYGTIDPRHVTATITSDHSARSGATGSLILMKDGRPAAELELTSENIGKPLPIMIGESPDPGEYTAKLSVDGQEKTLHFSITGKTAKPAPVAAGAWSVTVFSRNRKVSSGQSISYKDPAQGMLDAKDLTVEVKTGARLSRKTRIQLLWLVDGAPAAPPQDLTAQAVMKGVRNRYVNIPLPGAYTVRLLVNGKAARGLSFKMTE